VNHHLLPTICQLSNYLSVNNDIEKTVWRFCIEFGHIFLQIVFVTINHSFRWGCEPIKLALNTPMFAKHLSWHWHCHLFLIRVQLWCRNTKKLTQLLLLSSYIGENLRKNDVRPHQDTWTQFENKWLKLHNSKSHILKPEDNSRNEIVTVF